MIRDQTNWIRCDVCGRMAPPNRVRRVRLWHRESKEYGEWVSCDERECRSKVDSAKYQLAFGKFSGRF